MSAKPPSSGGPSYAIEGPEPVADLSPMLREVPAVPTGSRTGMRQRADLQHNAEAGADGPAPEAPARKAPASAAQTARWRKSRLSVTLAVALLLVGLIGAAGAYALHRKNVAAERRAAKVAAAAAARSAAVTASKPTIGTPSHDGRFEFIVKRVACGRSLVSAEETSRPAQGQYCVITLSVKNVGSRPQYFSETDQRAFGPNGVQFAVDSAATRIANRDPSVFTKELNPGNSATAMIVVDIPKDARITFLELHESKFSAGVRVRV